ncbi:hypothetical protein [Deinococcus sp.]|uniref:hypothetical protein n=1 Tax=Deinococcus sp. TaxID=47478 RepID=UPI003CC5A23A
MKTFVPGCILLLPLALSACGTASAPPPAQAQIVSTLKGVASGAVTTTLALNGGGRTLASAQTDAAGAFSLNLPGDIDTLGIETPLSAGVLSDLGCTGQLVVSDPAALGYEVAMLKAGGISYLNATVSRSLLSRTLSGRVYLYADRASAVSGTLDCSATTGLPTPVTVNLNVSRGWNVLALGINGSVGLGGVSVSGRLDNGAGEVGEISTWTDQDTVKAGLGS